MLNEFSRTELLLGKENMQKLKNSHIAIFGVGGVGGHAIDALTRTGIQTFSIFDDDKVCITNINRQLIATRKTVGKNKVDVMKEKILEINPKATVNIYNCFYAKENADKIDYSSFSYIIDAIDTVSSKILLVENANQFQIPIISSMGAGNKINPTMFEVSDIFKTSVCPLAKVMRKELKNRNIKSLKVVYSKEIPIKPIDESENSCKKNCVCPPDTQRKCSDRRQIPGSLAFVPSVVGLIISSEVVKDICGFSN